MVSQSPFNQDAWFNFARLIQRHPLLRRTLWERQQGRCQICGKGLKPDRFSIHHQNYDHACNTARRVRVKGCRGRLPPCHECRPADFDSCLDLLAGLCRLCHRRLHAPFK